jgi:hypothetical protein
MDLIKSGWYRYVGLTLMDVILAVALIIVILVWANIYANRRKEQDISFRYFVRGLAVRLGAVVVFCILYLTVYEGDTLDYFNSAVSMNHVLFDNPGHYFSLMFGGNKPEYYYFFSSATCFPEYHIWKDPQTFFVVRLISPVCLLGMNSFLLSNIIFAFISYIGPWKLFRLLCSMYPHLIKLLAFSVLMFPSVLFWGTGLLKDTITLCAALWLTYCIFTIFFQKSKIRTNIIMAIVMSYAILQIKPYIFISIVPGLLIWLFIKRVRQINNSIMRAILIPFAFIFVFGGVVLMFSTLGEMLGVYGNVDTMVNKINVTQSDLKRAEQYGSNYYDLGEVDASATGILLKSPMAVIAGLFRPFLWEARNPFVLLSALENLFLLGMVIFTLIRIGIKVYFTALFNDPFLTFSFLFSVIFSLGIGMAAANFGALVRYKIPLLPFFVSGMFIMLDFYRKGRKEKEDMLQTAREEIKQKSQEKLKSKTMMPE